MRDGQNLHAGLSFAVNNGKRKTLKNKFSSGELADRPSLMAIEITSPAAYSISSTNLAAAVW
jgi:hypothetical protein